MSQERSVKDLSGPYIERVVRPGGFELPTFWFVGGNCALHGTTAAYNTQRNPRKTQLAFGWRMTVLYPVHGQLHGQFALQQFQQAEHQFERQLKETFEGDSLQNGTETINSIERLFLGIGERAAHVIPDPQPTVRLTVRVSFSDRRPL